MRTFNTFVGKSFGAAHIIANIEFWAEYQTTLWNNCSFTFLHRGYDCKFKFSWQFFKNTFTADRGQLRDEIQRNLFCNTSGRLFLIPQNDCRKLKLAANQLYINNTQNKTFLAAHFFCQKETRRKISNIKGSLLKQNDSVIVETLVLRSNGLNDDVNVLILESTIEYITTTERFITSFWWNDLTE